MENNKHTPDQEEQSIISIIQEIKQETLNPKSLSKDVRQRCVEFLVSEGYTEAQVGQILNRSERTVSRDLSEVRARNVLTPSIDWAKQIAGELYQKAITHHRYLMRLARSSDATYSDKCQSEFLAWRVLKEAIEKFQTLGYLPLKPQHIVEDIFCHADGADSERNIAEARSALEAIEKASKESGKFDVETENKIKIIKAKIEKIEISDEIGKLIEKGNEPKPEGEAQDESQHKDGSV